MADEQMDNVEMLQQQATADTTQNDVVSIDLPAPQGWSKKFIPKKGGTPRRNEIVFIAPTGEEIKNKRQLDQYLKSHSGGPSATEFDWGTGDTPRRSSRLSSKPKETETPESRSSRKKQKRSNSKKGEQKKEDTDEEATSVDDETPADNTEASKDEEMKDVEVQGNLPEKILDDDSGSEAKPGTTSVDSAKGKADETKELGQTSNEVAFSDEKEIMPEDTKPEGALEQGIDQIPEETPGSGEEKPVGDVVLPENDKAVEEQPSENKEELEKELAGAEVQPEAEAETALLNIEKGGDEEAPANAETENDGSGLGQEDLEKKVASEEVGPNSNGAEGNQEAADHTDRKPVNADNSAHESYLF